MDKIIFIPQKRTQRQLIGFLYPEEMDTGLECGRYEYSAGLS